MIGFMLTTLKEDGVKTLLKSSYTIGKDRSYPHNLRKYWDSRSGKKHEEMA